MTAAADAHRAELASTDLHPTCPRCGDLSTDGAKWCGSCDTWLLDRGPTASELHGRQRLRAAAGNSGATATLPPYNDEGRFVVRTCTGYRIFPGETAQGGREGTDYYVCDSAVCYRIVKSWPAGAGSGRTNAERKRRAETHAMLLNAALAGDAPPRREDAQSNKEKRR